MMQYSVFPPPSTDDQRKLYDDLNYIFPIFRTQLEMLIDRDYDTYIEFTDKNNFVNIYYDILKDQKDQNIYTYLSQTYEARDPTKRPTFVYYHDPIRDSVKTDTALKTQVSQKSIVDFVFDLEKRQQQTGKYFNIIFITPYKLGSSAMQEFNKLNNYKNTFLHSQLMYNPVKHRSNSKFTILSEVEKRKFLVDNKILDETKIPGLYHNDIMALYYGAKVGNIVRLKRPNIYHQSTQKESISYRLVIPNASRTKAKQYTNTGVQLAEEDVYPEEDVYAEIDREVIPEEEEEIINEEENM